MNKFTTAAIAALLLSSNAVLAQQASADYTMTVTALNPFCTLSNPIDGTSGSWNLATKTFTNGTSPQVTASLRDYAYLIVDASDDVVGPSGVVPGAISDIVYSNGAFNGTFVSEYLGGLGDGDAGLLDFSATTGTVISGTLVVNPTVVMGASFQPQTVGDQYVTTFVVTCIQS